VNIPAGFFVWPLFFFCPVSRSWIEFTAFGDRCDSMADIPAIRCILWEFHRKTGGCHF
jgi:hypothetical protein